MCCRIGHLSSVLDPFNMSGVELCMPEECAELQGRLRHVACVILNV
jgi:hypothetical protein